MYEKRLTFFEALPDGTKGRPIIVLGNPELNWGRTSVDIEASLDMAGISPSNIDLNKLCNRLSGKEFYLYIEKEIFAIPSREEMKVEIDRTYISGMEMSSDSTIIDLNIKCEYSAKEDVHNEV